MQSAYRTGVANLLDESVIMRVDTYMAWGQQHRSSDS